MKIIKPTKVTVEFSDHSEAARYLAAYSNGTMKLFRTGEFGAFADDEAGMRLAASTAVRVLAEQYDRSVARDPEHAAPTYISGSSDKVYLLSEMPTRYMVNVLNMEDARRAIGLSCAIRDELRRRGERA